MKKRKSLSIKIILFSFLFTFLVLSPLTAQSKLKVGVVPVVNRTNLAYIDSLASAVEENVLFIGNQLGRYSIIDSTSVKIEDPTEISALKKIAKSRRCDYLISGQVTQQQGVYVLTLVLFDAGEEKIQSLKNSRFNRLIEVFNISDKLTISVLEELTGEHIKRGTVFFVNKTPGTAFSVMVNRRQLEDNVTAVTLIEGKYSIKIFNTSGSKKRVLSKTIEVIEGDPIYVEFDLSRKVKATFDKKNTIRTTLPGAMLLATDNPDEESGKELQLLAWTAPSVSYTRMFNERIGLNVGLGIVTSPNIFIPRDSIGFEVKAGPCIRFGRIGLIPMLGYSIVFVTPKLGEYTIEDLRDQKTPGDVNDTASLSQQLLVLLGFEFFFTPVVSGYLEAGIAVGHHEEVDHGSVVRYISEDSTGILFSLGLGISF